MSGTETTLLLKVTEMSPWVDSRGRLRSPADEFSLLAHGVDPTFRAGVVLWEIGVLAVDEAPPSSKPQAVVGPRDEVTEAFALGGIGAEAANRALLSFWSEVLRVLVGNEGTRMFATDPRAAVDETGVDLDRMLREILNLDHIPHTSRKRRSTLRLTTENLVQLSKQWWPSGLGFLSAVTLLPGTPAEVDEAIARDGEVTESEIAHVECLFETFRSYDNAGLGIISTEHVRTRVVEHLAGAGLRSGSILSPGWAIPNAPAAPSGSYPLIEKQGK
jgi:hypothetical protein